MEVQRALLLMWMLQMISEKLVSMEEIQKNVDRPLFFLKFQKNQLVWRSLLKFFWEWTQQRSYFRKTSQYGGSHFSLNILKHLMNFRKTSQYGGLSSLIPLQIPRSYNFRKTSQYGGISLRMVIQEKHQQFQKNQLVWRESLSDQLFPI